MCDEQPAAEPRSTATNSAAPTTAGATYRVRIRNSQVVDGDTARIGEEAVVSVAAVDDVALAIDGQRQPAGKLKANSCDVSVILLVRSMT